MKKLLRTFLGILKFLLPALYIAGAVFVWMIFSVASPDGLANVGIVIYTFPIVAIGTYLLNLNFPYVSGGYYEAHALYFWPSVAILAFSLFSFCSALQEIVGPRVSKLSDSKPV